MSFTSSIGRWQWLLSKAYAYIHISRQKQLKKLKLSQRTSLIKNIIYVIIQVKI